jgi:L-fuconolactonase
VAVLAELFGPERLVWGSDWPVVNLAGGYIRWREAAERLAAHYLPDGATAVFGGNAVRLYLSTVA